MQDENQDLGKYFSTEANKAIVFNYINLSEEQADKIKYLKNMAGNLFDFIRSTESEKGYNHKTIAIALSNLETTIMYATKAIAQIDYEKPH